MNRRKVTKSRDTQRTNPMKSCNIFMGFFLFKAQASLGLNLVSSQQLAVGSKHCEPPTAYC